MSAEATSSSAAPGADATDARCQACGTSLAGAHCHRCGQPSAAARLRLAEALLGHTGRLMHTLRLLLTRPGELARETDECRDRDAIRPLTLLLNVVAFFFLLSALTDFRLHSFERQDSTGQLAQAMERYADTAGVDRELFVERAERRFQSAYTVFLTASVAVYALLFALSHRRPHRTWLVHAAAAVHYACFVFLVALVSFVALRPFGVASISIGALVPQLVIAFAYLTLMFRRAYGDSLKRALAAALLVSALGLVIDGTVFVLSLNVELLTA